MSSPPVRTHGVHTPASVTKVTLETALNAIITQVRVAIDPFRVALILIMKANLSVKFLLRKLVFIHMRTKPIFT